MSFYSINKKTGERINALSIKNDPKYEFPEQEEWLSDGEGIHNWEEIKEKYPEIKQVFVKEKKTINYNGTQFASSPHFRIPNATKLGINYVPESPEHKIVKGWIYKNYSSLKICWAQHNKMAINSIYLKELPIDLNQLSFSEVTEEGRVKSQKTRIADVLFIFSKKHSVLGDGIVFEVQFSAQRESTEHERTIDWALKGFSVCWIKFNDIKKLSEEQVTFKNDLLVQSFSSIIHVASKEWIKNLKFCVQEETRKVRSELESVKEELSFFIEKRVVETVSQNIDYNNLIQRLKKLETEILNNPQQAPNCYKCGKLMVLRSKGESKFWGCLSYKTCLSKGIPYIGK